MVLCKFYQQGYCKFGDNCRFEHASGYKQNRNDYYKENVRQSQPQQQQQYPRYENTSNRYEVLNDYKKKNQSQNVTGEANLSFEDFVQTTINEIGVTANSQKQWPLSCFGPSKEGDLYPDLEDVSPEEWRWEYTQSLIQGNVNEFVQKMTQMVIQQEIVLNEIRNRSPKAMNYLQRIYQSQKINMQSPLLSKPAYGSQNENLSPNNFSFRQAQLGNAQSTEFSNSFQSQEASAIGAIPLNSSFNNSAFNHPSQPANSTPSNFSFRTPPQQQQQIPPSGFGSGQVDFQNSGPAYGNSAVGFGNSNASYGVSSGGSENLNQGFVSSQIASDYSKQNEHSFNSSTPNNLGQVTPGYKKSNSILYSNAEELSGEEREQFAASLFVLGKVPANPPSYDFC